MKSIRAHFDGEHSLVLDEAVDLPVGTPLNIHIETIEQSHQSTNSAEEPRLLGILKGKISMSDDFDEPLDDFKDYQ